MPVKGLKTVQLAHQFIVIVGQFTFGAAASSLKVIKFMGDRGFSRKLIKLKTRHIKRDKIYTLTNVGDMLRSSVNG